MAGHSKRLIREQTLHPTKQSKTIKRNNFFMKVATFQTPVIYFCRGFTAVRIIGVSYSNSEVSARRALTVASLAILYISCIHITPNSGFCTEDGRSVIRNMFTIKKVATFIKIIS